jgi:hypothetical protein
MYTVSNKAKVLHPLSADSIKSRYQWLSLEMAEPNLGVPKGPESIGLAGTVTYLLSSDAIGNRGWASATTLSITFSSDERPDIPTINDAINELFYKWPEVRIFVLNLTASPYYEEYGTTIAPASLSWASVKENGRAITTWYLNVSGVNASTSQWITGAWDFSSYQLGSLSGELNQSFVYYLTAEDWKGNRGYASFTLKFVGPTYIGTTTTTNISAAEVLGGLQQIRYSDYLRGNFNLPTAGGKRFYFAFPPGAAIPTFRFGTFTYIPETLNSINITSPNTSITLPFTIKYSTDPYAQNVNLTLL